MDDRVPILDRSDYSVLWVSKTWSDCYDELRKSIIMSMCIPKELLDDPQATFVSLKKPTF